MKGYGSFAPGPHAEAPPVRSMHTGLFFSLSVDRTKCIHAQVSHSMLARVCGHSIT